VLKYVWIDFGWQMLAAFLRASNAITGTGVDEGIMWMAEHLKSKNRK
jgi:hypothetical protein